MIFTNFVYDAVPIKPVMVDPYVTSINTETTFLVWGSGFEKTLNVHLSGSAVDSIKYEINPFAGSPLETSYPKFNGITLPLSAWSASSEDNFIKFTIPKIATPGLFDVIVQNAYSYGNLKKKCKDISKRNSPIFSSICKWNKNFFKYSVVLILFCEIIEGVMNTTLIKPITEITGRK